MCPDVDTVWFVSDLHMKYTVEVDPRCKHSVLFVIMPYYGLFSHDLHILDLQWRSPLCSQLVVDITPDVNPVWFVLDLHMLK